MGDRKRVDGDWAFTVQEVRAFEGSLKKSGSKLRECDNKSIDVMKEYGCRG